MAKWIEDAPVLAKSAGIILPGVTAYTSQVGHLPAFDAADTYTPGTPNTDPNNGPLMQALTIIDPEIIRILLSPMRAAKIYGEEKRGDWLRDGMAFSVVEQGGQVAAYGDFNMAGYGQANINYEWRQQFLVQAFAEWGEREAARWDAGGMPYIMEKRRSVVTILNKWQNRSYFFGISGLQAYGALNDPSLPASVAPQPQTINGTSVTTWAEKDGQGVYDDILYLYTQLVDQTYGMDGVTSDSNLVLVLSNKRITALNKTNAQFNTSVYDLLKKNFPNMRIEQAPELSLASGEMVQMFAERMDGARTVFCAFSEKLRAHRLILSDSGARQKQTNGSWGAIIRYPLAFTSMVGV